MGSVDKLDNLKQCSRYAALMAFNRWPSRYLHDSWRIEFADAGLCDFLFGSPYAHASLSDRILQENHLSDVSDEDSDQPAVQIGMRLNTLQLQELACRVGLILAGRSIRQAISQTEVAAWIDALGLPHYRFACRQAPLLGGDRFLALPEWQSQPLSTDMAAEQAAAIGSRFLATCTHLLDNAIGQRIRFKLPHAIASTASTASTAQQANLSINADHYSKVWTWLYRIWNSTPTSALPSAIADRTAYK
jgi:hypothetical protein